MPRSSLRLSIVRGEIDGVLRRLADLPPSADVVGLRAKAEEYLGEVNGWITSPPTPDASEELMRRVLKLRVRVAKLDRQGPQVVTAQGVRIGQRGPAIKPGDRLVLDWPAPPQGVWKVVGLRVTEEASAFHLVEALAHESRLIDESVPCSTFAPYVQPWELDALSPTVPREVDPERLALPSVTVHFTEHTLVVGSRLRLRMQNRHQGKALNFRAALFVREL
jgi:hypothetical protein